MTRPVRLLESGDLPKGAKELLAAAAPPPAFTDAVRLRLGIGVAKTASLPLTSAWMSIAAKGAAIVALGGASGYVVHALESRHDKVAPPPAAVVAAAPAARPAEPAPPAEVGVTPILELPTAAPDRAPKLKLDSRLEEAELLEKARSMLGSNPAQALKLTFDYAREFPKGRLGAEADLIAAQSLLGMGKLSAAKERARASLRRYPHGLYERQLREIAEP